jgi:hypothetical protein
MVAMHSRVAVRSTDRIICMFATRYLDLFHDKLDAAGADVLSLSDGQLF